MNITETLTDKEKRYLRHIILEKDHVLFHENDLCESIGIIISGEISIVSYLEDGKEIIFNTLQENGIFGNNLLFSSHPYYKGDILALKQCEIELIYKEDLLELLKHNEVFLEQYLSIQADFAKSLNNQIKLLSIDSARERFIFYLHENHNIIAYDTISSLAKRMYLKRETLSRTVSQLQKEKYIIKEKGIIRLNTRR